MRLPILGLDLNDGLGLDRGRRIRSDALSAGCNRDEGYGGKLFREMMEQQKMYAASGHFRPLVTYHGPQGGQTSIHFISLPQSYAGSYQSLGALSQRTNPAARCSPAPPGPRSRRGQICIRPRNVQTAATRTDQTGHGACRSRHEDGLSKGDIHEKIEEGAQEAATRHPLHSTMADSK